MPNANLDHISRRAYRIWEQQPGEKFTYRLKCKFKYELQRFSSYGALKPSYPKKERTFPAHFNNQASYSECLQDIFVLKMCGGKQGGTYLEIGSGPAVENSNTFLLETHFAWEGLSLDFNPNFVADFKQRRRNPVEHTDATSFDYDHKLREYKLPSHIDYLQIDIDPSYQSLKTLFQIPFSKYKFATITFEHDKYRTSNEIASLSRQKLRKEGYILVAKNVLAKKGHPFEDWWVHPDLIPRETYSKYLCNRNLPSDFLKR